ncbi:MAG TPA: hypothetical protein VMT18_07850, partial [Planctomycetota bacterium]|nr:hypothetical protein [Planctomycetota bacterium]
TTRRILILDGETSPAFLRHTSAALETLFEGSERRVLAGLDHAALFTAPQALVPPLREFLLAPAEGAR